MHIMLGLFLFYAILRILWEEKKNFLYIFIYYFFFFLIPPESSGTGIIIYFGNIGGMILIISLTIKTSRIRK